MSLLIAVKSCDKHRCGYYNQAIRDTWGKDVFPSSLLFFQGRAEGELKADEVELDVADNYNSLPEKTRAILRYFLSWNFSHVFLADTDTFIIPSKLEKCGYENYDIAGRYGNTFPIGTTADIRDDRGVARRNVHPWPSGGVGYFLSRKAAELVLSTPYEHWAEDYMVGQITGRHIQSGELKAVDLPEFECQVSWHFPRKIYKQKYDLTFGWMQKMQSEYGQSHVR